MAKRPTPINFGMESTPARHGPDGGAEHINCYVEPTKDGVTETPIYATDGLDEFATLTNGTGWRGGLVIDDIAYVVDGLYLFEVDTEGTATALGSIAGELPVQMCRNEASPPQITMVTDGLRYVYDGSTVSEITDPDLPAPIGCATLNGRTIYALPGGRIFRSAINDTTDISALDFHSAEADPDGLTAIIEHRKDLLLFGHKTIENHHDTGAESNPIRPRTQVLNVGCLAAHSVAQLNNHVLFVGHDDVVYMTDGYSLTPISSSPVSRDLEAVTDKTELRGFAYYQRGHAFYTLSSASWTWRYNATTKKWFQIESDTGAEARRWDFEGYLQFANGHIHGHKSAGKLYKVNRETFTEAGSPSAMVIKSPPNHAWPNQMRVDRLHLHFVTGVGLNSQLSHEETPEVIISWSDDGGRTFRRSRRRSLGERGQYRKTVTVNGCGVTGRQGRIWKVECAAPAVRCFMGAAIEGRLLNTAATGKA